MARLRCATSSGLQTYVLGVITGILFVLWLQPQQLPAPHSSVSVVTTVSDGRYPSGTVGDVKLPAADSKPCQCPVCTPCTAGASAAGPQERGAAGEGGQPGTTDPAFLVGNVERTYYSPLIKQLADFGPPEASCLPSLDDSAPAVFPPKKRKFDMVLILAQGRSGSTSLMRLLNTIPCYNIRGENLFLFAKLMGAGKGGPLMADTLRESALKLQAHYVHPWNETRYREPKLPKKPSYFNRFDMARLDDLSKLAVYEVLQHVPGYVTSGFKELRLFNLNAYQYNMSINFLDHWTTLFPRTAIIFGYREKDIMNSAWWKDSDRAWTEKLLKQQLEWFREIHDLVNSRKRFGAGVESVMVEFDDLVACNDGPSSGLKQAYDMLGEKFDAANCQALMQNNVEDMGLAASESNFKAEQGFKSWFYGYRELSGGKLSDFRHLNFSRPIANGGNEKEFIGPKQDGTFDEIYSIRRNYQRPAIPDRKKDLAYAACRQWHADTESANVKITLSAYGVPGRCDKDAKLVMKLLKDGSEVLHEKEIELTNNGEASPPPYEANVITGLPKGTVLELCLEPRARVCEGLGVRMVVNRHGPPRSKKPAER